MVDIKTYEELLQSREQFRLLFERAPMAYQSLDRFGCIITVNQAWLDTLGYDREDVLGRSFGDFLHPDWHDHFKENFPRFKAVGEVLGIEFEMRRKDGRFITVSFTGKIGKDEVGEFIQTHCIFNDISQQNEAARRLQASEERFRIIFEQAAVGVAQLETRTGRFQMINQKFCDIIGYPREEITESTFMDITHPEDLPADLDFMKQLVNGEIRDFSMEKRYFHKKGSIVWVYLAVSAMWKVGEEPTSHIAVVKDITERKRAEEALSESEKKFRLFMKYLPAFAFMKDSDKRVTYLNERYEEDFGIKVADWMGKTNEDIWPPDLAGRMNQSDDAVLQEGKTVEVMEEIPRKGEKRNFLTRKFPIKRPGKSTLVAGVALDITELRQASAALRWERDRAQSYLDTVQTIIVALDQVGRVTLINQKGCEILGLSEEELLGQNWFAVCLPQPEGMENIYPSFLAFIAGQPGVAEYFENPILNQEGELRQIAWHNALVRDDQGEIVGSLSAGIDITESERAAEEKKALEIQLRQAMKMEAIGTLAGGIAHDFNNILSAIIGYTELGQLDAPKGSGLENNLKEVLKASNRAKDLVRQILTFSRRSDKALKPVQINRVIREALKLLRASLPSTIDIRQEVNSDDYVMADPTQIHQVLMNLCMNAGHAMLEKGGRLEVRLDNRELDSHFVKKFPQMEPGSFLQLTVSDTGYGMPPEVMDRIFDPFFTQKDVGEGTGLGLSVAHGIIRSHGGVIDAQSEPGKGSRFTVFLPRVEPKLTEESEDKIEELPRGSESILLVDDEEPLVVLGERMLKRLGYSVVSMNRSVEALAVFRAHPDQYDLVISDLTMPGMPGDQLAEELALIRPDIPIILSTGFSQRVDRESAGKMGIRAFVMKPYTMREIAETIRRVLDTPDHESG